ncbi:MAG TPA: adenylate/guanylate cyclase domain-containing protein [Gaiellaceae bacterium]|nr:adenylate/guanylate cyclase domain-containing protein [Gaiellaceae bacterium]
MAPVPETRYAVSGGYHVAYQVAEGADRDILYVPRMTTPIDLLWDDPIVARGLRRLMGCGRLIMCDFRGVGASDSIDATRLPALQAWVDDIGAVLDAAGSEQATLIAGSESALPVMLFAATYPERTSGIVLINAFACFVRTPETPFAMPAESAKQYVELYKTIAGTGELVAYLAPSRAGEPAFRRWLARGQRLGAGPGTAAAIYDAFMHTDLSGVLPSIRVPTLILHRAGDPHVRAGHAQYLAKRIAGAQLVTLPGADNEWFSGEIEPLFDEVEQFVTGIRRARRSDRVLATILFTDIVGSSEQAATLGDAAWKGLLEAYGELLRSHIESFGGRLIDTAGDGALATFDGPARAIYCACGIRDSVAALGLAIRAGLHTGEVELRNEGIGGLAVHIGARVSALADPDEVLVSASVPPLVVGSAIRFTPRGSHTLKGIPDAWDVYRVDDGA